MLDKNPVAPRAECSSRRYRTLTYQEVDRVPDVEFGYWPQTARRWLAEGMDADLSDNDINGMFGGWLGEHFGLDTCDTCDLNSRTHLMPEFDYEFIERRENSIVVRYGSGAIAEQFESDQDESSIPHFLEFPVKTPDDWAAMKFRHDPNHPDRKIPQEEIDAAMAGAAEGKEVVLGFMGPYGKLRDLMGFEGLSVAFFDFPDMIADIMETWTELMLDQIAQLPPELPIDYVQWWEDMAGRNGPFVSPTMFREILQPCYHAVMVEAKKHGCAISHVDCDGNPHDIVANWMEEGVNVMFPLEVAAGVDPFAWREEFGKEMRIVGAVDKRALTLGPAAIDAELERLKPLMDRGGFIPHLDHLVPPDISYDNYRYYIDAKHKFIGKT